MKNNIILILKGLIIGFAKIIPGVSGAMLAITLNVYEKALESISNFFNNMFNNIKFLGLLGIGLLISMILGSNIINYLFNNFYLPTMLLFIGLILGGLKEIKVKNIKTKKNIIFFLLPLLIVLFLCTIKTNSKDMVFQMNIYTYLILFLIGIIEAITMVIPGISGTAIMLILGCYRPMLKIWANILNINEILTNVVFLLPFMVGVIFGIIIIAKIMNYLLKKYSEQTYSAILGFSIGSVLLLLLNTFKSSYNFSELIIGLILLILGYKLSLYLDKLK